ncbi:MAG: helix-turn-helix domain-containing protein [Betaproteobacteria bacterium]|nr:helix-turn-helix domain-containing protein [Betaproteobacteria bacterium]
MQARKRDASHCDAVGDGSRLRVVSYDPGLTQRRHAHDYASITLILGGGLEERAGRSTRQVARGWMCVKAPGVEHACRFGGERTQTLQLRLAAPGLLNDSLGDSSLPSWTWRPPGRLISEMLALLRLRDTPRLPDRATEAEERVQDLLAAFLAPTRRAPERAPAWLPRMREALVDGHESVDELARACGVHRVHFARCFRHHVGVPPARYRRLMRVLRAINAVRRDPTALAAIAAAEGFADQSHMIREVRAETGLTPLAWRRWAQ